MYRLEIGGIYHGNYSSTTEAMSIVQQRARPYGMSWTIFDQYGRVWAQG